jgi:hypothetical protein
MKNMSLQQTMKRAALAAAVSLACVGWSRAAAASDGGGTVQWVQQLPMGDGNVVYFVMTTTPASASCATTQRWATWDKPVFDLVLAAFLSGKPISVIGKGTCTENWPDAEDIYYLQVG